MPNRDDVSAAAAFNFIDIEKSGQLASRYTCQFLLHVPSAGVVEMANYPAMTIIRFLSKLIQQLVNERSDTSLL